MHSLPILRYRTEHLGDTYPAEISIGTFSDLGNFPILTKEHLRSFGAEGMITVDSNNLFSYHESFGTTGIPVSTWLTKNDFDAYVAQLEESPVNITEADTICIRFPYAISVPAHIFTEMARKRGACVIPASRATHISHHSRVLNLMEKCKTTILCCNPHEAFTLKAVADHLNKSISECFPCLRAICVAGEMLATNRRKRLEEEWQVPVYEFFGSTETGNIATSCDKGEMHISSDHFIVEAVDSDTGKQVPEGELGSCLVTTLSKENFPLLRYELGDLVSIHKSKCHCGNSAPIMKHMGRQSDVISNSSNVVTLRDIQEQLFALPKEVAGNFFSIAITDNSVKISIESEGFHKPDTAHLIEENISIPASVEPVAPGSILNVESLLTFDKISKPSYVQKN